MTDLIAAGPKNLITDVPGLSVGNADDARVRSGVTVLLSTKAGGKAGFRAAVEQRGGAPGTRETDALAPGALVKAINAIVLSGGSAFGLDAAGGVQSWLAARGVGYRIHGAVVPIVPAAILFDLANGGEKDWGETPPYRDLGKAACRAASERFDLGNAGAGYGALAGPYKGGLGSASAIDPASGFTLGGLVAVNSFGSPVTPDGETLWAAPYELSGELGDLPTPSRKTGGAFVAKSQANPRGNTTIGIAATDAPLNDDQLAKVHQMSAARAREQYRTYIGVALTIIERKVPLTIAERTKIIELMLEKTDPPESYGDSTTPIRKVLEQMVQIESELEQMLAPDEWKIFGAILQINDPDRGVKRW